MSITIKKYEKDPFADFLLTFECGCRFLLGVIVEGDKKTKYTPYVIDDVDNSFKPCKIHRTELISKIKEIIKKEDKELEETEKERAITKQKRNG